MKIIGVGNTQKNAKNIYPDTLKKEVARFKETFKELLTEENVDLDA